MCRRSRPLPTRPGGARSYSFTRRGHAPPPPRQQRCRGPPPRDPPWFSSAPCRFGPILRRIGTRQGGQNQPPLTTGGTRSARVEAMPFVFSGVTFVLATLLYGASSSLFYLDIVRDRGG